MREKVLFSLGIVLGVALGIAAGIGAQVVIGQGSPIVLLPGESAVCATCPAASTDVPDETDTPVPTSTSTHVPDETDTPVPTATDTPIPTATGTPSPTSTTVPPTSTATPTSTDVPETDTPVPTDTPAPSGVWHGVVRIPDDRWQTARDELGASWIEFRVTPGWRDADILDGLDAAGALGLKVLLHIYDGSRNTDKPWSISGGSWSVSARGVEILQLVEGHPALGAVYILHEPYDSRDYEADSDAQRALYALLHSYADVPLWTDIASLARPVAEGEVLSDGMCDYCCTFPTAWHRGMATVLSRINGDYAAWRGQMPGSQLVFMINVYETSDGYYQLPTFEELRTARALMCSYGVPQVYYPWQHGSYSREIGDLPAYWPVIAEGCD